MLPLSVVVIGNCTDSLSLNRLNSFSSVSALSLRDAPNVKLRVSSYFFTGDNATVRARDD